MEPIGKANLSKEVMNAILNTIKSQQFKPGDRLPPIKELSEKLMVGISSIREGLKQLQSMGIITIVQGKGTYVSENLDMDHFLNSFKGLITLQRQDFFNVMEARKIIECETAGMAAKQAEDHEIEKLSNLLLQMEKNETQPELYDEFDVEFHIAIAEAAKNPVLVAFLKSIQGLISKIVQEMVQIPGQPKDANIHHRNIFNAIKKHNAEKATENMRAHLSEVVNTASNYLYSNHD